MVHEAPATMLAQRAMMGVRARPNRTNADAVPNVPRATTTLGTSLAFIQPSTSEPPMARDREHRSLGFRSS
jgi:hypothetical protein